MGTTPVSYTHLYDDISDKDKLFDEYAIKGGLAGSYAYRTEKDRTNYIKEVYETIVTRDLVQKYTLPDTLVLQRLSEFLMDKMCIRDSCWSKKMSGSLP